MTGVPGHNAAREILRDVRRRGLSRAAALARRTVTRARHRPDHLVGHAVLHRSRCSGRAMREDARRHRDLRSTARYTRGARRVRRCSRRAVGRAIDAARRPRRARRRDRCSRRSRARRSRLVQGPVTLRRRRGCWRAWRWRPRSTIPRSRRCIISRDLVPARASRRSRCSAASRARCSGRCRSGCSRRTGLPLAFGAVRGAAPGRLPAAAPRMCVPRARRSRAAASRRRRRRASPTRDARQVYALAGRSRWRLASFVASALSAHLIEAAHRRAGLAACATPCWSAR